MSLQELESQQDLLQSQPGFELTQRQPVQKPRRRLSLSVRVSLGLVIAALLPLLFTVIFSEIQARPTLTAQANTAMESDAQTRVQLIDTYFNERQLDTATLAQVPSVQQFLSVPPAPTPFYQNLALHASYSLVAGIFRDKNYTTWQLFDPKGQMRLYYPLNNKPKPHGKNLVPPDDLQAVQGTKPGGTSISAVYYSPETKKASVDIYSPIYLQPTTDAQKQNPTYLGFIRATLNLDYIWNIVHGDLGSNGKGSYAFILDENGVRIADTDAGRLFQAVTPLGPTLQQQVLRDARYGSTTEPVAVLADNTVARQLQSTATQTTFQTQPAGQREQFQVVQHSTTIVPWRYFVLSPVSTVTAVADQQLQATMLIAFAVCVLIAIIGLIAGRSITRPILASVNYLRDNSHSLTTLATHQQDAASEQAWVVDSSQVGLQSVQYYTEAIRIAAHELNEIGTGLAQHRETVDLWQINSTLERLVAASRYIENAAHYQEVSNQKLATALKVATQVTEQLVAGATSATDAAAQLEDVVTQLRTVVGK